MFSSFNTEKYKLGNFMHNPRKLGLYYTLPSLYFSVLNLKIFSIGLLLYDLVHLLILCYCHNLARLNPGDNDYEQGKRMNFSS